MFHSASEGARSSPTTFLRKACGCTYCPSIRCVGYSTSCRASAIVFCLLGSVSLAKVSRSFSISASHGQPNVAFSQLALRYDVATGSRISTEAHEVRNALQPPALGGSFLVRRVTNVCQSIACRSTLKPAFSKSDLVTGARLLSEAMSVDCISTTGDPS